MVAMEIVVTMATERVIDTLQYKVATVSYLHYHYLNYIKAQKAQLWYADASSP